MTFAAGFICGWITTAIVTLIAIAAMRSGTRAEAREADAMYFDAVRAAKRKRLTKTGDISERQLHH